MACGLHRSRRARPPRNKAPQRWLHSIPSRLDEIDLTDKLADKIVVDPVGATMAIREFRRELACRRPSWNAMIRNGCDHAAPTNTGALFHVKRLH